MDRLEELYERFIETDGVTSTAWKNALFDTLDEGISDKEVEKILSKMTFYQDIACELIGAGDVPKELIEKYNLQALVEKVEYSGFEDGEEFPGRAVRNRESLRAHIRDQFFNSPNPYVEKKRVVKEPMHTLNTVTYSNSMYRSRNSEGCVFCQMCKRKNVEKYMRHFSVQVHPKYGWEQTYLSLCMQCGSDYGKLRNNKDARREFLKKLKSATIATDDEVIEIPIGDRTITFTATHLAEIQEIFKVEKEK